MRDYKATGKLPPSRMKAASGSAVAVGGAGASMEHHGEHEDVEDDEEDDEGDE